MRVCGSPHLRQHRVSLLLARSDKSLAHGVQFPLGLLGYCVPLCLDSMADDRAIYPRLKFRPTGAQSAPTTSDEEHLCKPPSWFRS